MQDELKIKVTDIDLKVRESTALIIEIDTFRFMKTCGIGCVTVEINDNGEYEYLDEIHIEDKHIHITDLERIALNWIFKYVEIVDGGEINE